MQIASQREFLETRSSIIGQALVGQGVRSDSTLTLFLAIVFLQPAATWRSQMTACRPKRLEYVHPDWCLPIFGFYAEFWQRPNFLVDSLKMLPWPDLPGVTKAHFEKLINREVEQRRLAYQNHEPFHEFLVPAKVRDFSRGGEALSFSPESLLDKNTEKMVADAFGFSEDQVRTIERDLLEKL